MGNLTGQDRQLLIIVRSSVGCSSLDRQTANLIPRQFNSPPTLPVTWYIDTVEDARKLRPILMSVWLYAGLSFLVTNRDGIVVSFVVESPLDGIHEVFLRSLKRVSN